ncbi:MAG: FkbM family methyltransferase [Candidatus Omnitrophica bacterium]|nr:FkbM family methyltransferase [Candidatus Omnitrophota bacterium]
MLIKKIYELIPFKKQIYSFIKLFWIPPETIFKHLYFKSKIRVKINKTSFFMQHYGYAIENQVFWKGLEGYEKTSMDIWIKSCKKSKVILDIGANTGIYSLVAKTINPLAEVYAFEPIPRIFQKLQYNCQLNNYNIYCQPYALSNSNGKAVISNTSAENSYPATLSKNLDYSNSKIVKTTIPTQTLNRFIEEKQLTRIDLIKIDTESHELEILKGFKNLNEFRPILLIEIFYKDIAQNIKNLLKNYIYLNADSYNYIFIPKEKAQNLLPNI